MPLTLHLFTWRAGAMGSRLPTWVTGQAPGPALPRLRWGSAPSPMGATLTTPFPGQAFVISFTPLTSVMCSKNFCPFIYLLWVTLNSF